MRQLKDINDKLRICTRCNSGEPAVFKKSSEWLCEKCLEHRKERQATTAAMPKCHKCNAPAMHGLPYCNNHVPQVDPVHELECRVTVLEQQLQQARREGWEQCQRDAVKAAKYSHHPESCFCDWCAIAHKASDDVAAMTYKEPTNICLKEIDRLKGELEEYKKICDTWETIDKQSNALLSTVKAALEQEEAHTTELCKELAEARAEIDKTYKTWCGRDYMHLPLSTAMGSVVAQARQEAASECIEAIEYEHGILGLAFTLRQRFGLDDE